VCSQAGWQFTRLPQRMCCYSLHFFPVQCPWYYHCAKCIQHHIIFQRVVPDHRPWILVAVFGQHTWCNRVLAQKVLLLFTYYPYLEGAFWKAWTICQMLLEILDKNAQPIHANFLHSLYTNFLLLQNHRITES